MEIIYILVYAFSYSEPLGFPDKCADLKIDFYSWNLNLDILDTEIHMTFLCATIANLSMPTSSPPTIKAIGLSTGKANHHENGTCYKQPCL